MLLNDKRVVIIGGSSGIGFATAVAAMAEGAEVIIAGRSQDKLKRARQKIGNDVTACQLDLADKSDVQQFFKDLGSIDHLQLPGSRSITGPFLSLDTDKARATFESKFWGAYDAAKYAAPYINAGGSITLFSGRLSQRPVGPGSAVLSAVNSALEGFGRGLAVELAPIRVNILSPGLTDTELFTNLSAEEREDFFSKNSKDFVIKRPAQPEEIAHGAVYLMSNSFTTGSTLFIDGGFTFK